MPLPCSEILQGSWHCLSVSASAIKDFVVSGNKTNEAPANVRDRIWHQILNLAEIEVPRT